MKAQIEGGARAFGETLRHARFFREKFSTLPVPLPFPKRATVSTRFLASNYRVLRLCLEFSPESFPLERARVVFPKFYLAVAASVSPCNNYYFNALCLKHKNFQSSQCVIIRLFFQFMSEICFLSRCLIYLCE